MKARCVTTKKARKDGYLPAPVPVGRRKIMIMNDRGIMIIQAYFIFIILSLNAEEMKFTSNFFSLPFMTKISSNF